MASTQRLDDGDLVRQACRGDVGAYAALVERHQQQLLYRPVALVGSAEAAEDLVQQTSVLAYVRLSEAPGDREFQTWLTQLMSTCRGGVKRGKQ